MREFLLEHEDYRTAVRRRLQSMPKRGHGQLAKIARVLGVHPTLLTQILNGSKKLAPEHALLIAEYLGFGHLETEYFLQLVELERAGHFKLKARIRERLEKLREQHHLPQSRMTKFKVLPEQAQATFYSNWFFSAVRLLAGIKGHSNVDEIASRLGLERKSAQFALRFLLQTGLLVQEKNRLRLGPQRTYLPADSIFMARHHTNWRIKAIENFDHLTSQELAFTGPISISKKDFAEAKKILLRALEEISTLVEKSEEEVVGCVNLDLFLVTKT